jgi:predicted CopG family antitoxin
MAANNTIRVTDRVKSIIDERRREGESYSDALERILGGDRDLTDGMGFWSGSDADDDAREVHERGKRKTLDRTG